MVKYLRQLILDLLIKIQTKEIVIELQNLIKDINYLYLNVDDLKEVVTMETIQQSAYIDYLICSEKSARELIRLSSC